MLSFFLPLAAPTCRALSALLFPFLLLISNLFPTLPDTPPTCSLLPTPLPRSDYSERSTVSLKWARTLPFLLSLPFSLTDFALDLPLIAYSSLAALVLAPTPRSSLMRSLGPFGASSLFAFSLSHPTLLGGQLVFLVMVVLAIGGAFSAQWLQEGGRASAVQVEEE
jgi:hypothetical protein